MKEKAKTLFAAAVNAKVRKREKQLNEQVENRVRSNRQEMINLVDEFLTEAVDSWISDNQEEFDNKIRAELNESFIAGLGNLFREHYIDVPEGKEDGFKKLNEEYNSLQSKVHSSVEKSLALKRSNMFLKGKINQLRKEKVLLQESKNLSESQADKLRVLSESISADNVTDYKKKLSTLCESVILGKPSKQQSDISFENDFADEDLISEGFDPYIDEIAKLIS